MKQTQKEERAKRLAACNTVIAAIASCGRKFFTHTPPGLETQVGRLEIKGGHVYFFDANSKKWIFTSRDVGYWRGFSEGGTMRSLVVAMRNHIQKGTKLTHAFGPWPDWYSDGDPWGYGADMIAVRAAAALHGLIESKPVTLEITTWAGLSLGARHYYGKLFALVNGEMKRHDMVRVLTQADADKENEREDGFRWKEGMLRSGYDTIPDLVAAAQAEYPKVFPNHTNLLVEDLT